MLIAACSTFLGETPAGTSPGGPDPGAATTEPDPNSCLRFTGDHSQPIDTGALAADALFLAGETFVCANDVVVVGEHDINEIVAASQLAAALTGPLLFPEPRLAAELGRLKPRRLHLIGSVTVNGPVGAEVITHDIPGALQLAAETLGVTAETAVPATPDAGTIVETVLAIEGGDRIVVPETAAETTLPGAEPEIDEKAIVTGLAASTEATSLWLVDAAQPKSILLASAMGNALGAEVIAIDATDILGHPEVGAALEGHTGDTIRTVGTFPDGAHWELRVLANGQQVPGGGFRILPEQKRRYVAFYGHPETTVLGVLGEQGPAETLARMQEYITAYAGDGSQVIPTFEIIASVASAGPTEDGDYSFEWPAETFQAWIDFARENDLYVVLDLQSGRDDFLSQAVQYQKLLELPFVGLALDPEWRLEQDQTHLNQTGSVDAAEVNATVNWVADLVQDKGLPQKLMIVHQFKPSMITNRDQLVQRPEIQMLVQMDGDGTEAQKDATWSRILEGAGDVHWAWGWKNFFDEDEPGPPSPEVTMEKVPTPVYVSYQ